MSYRVIQWYTGSIAREQIRALPGTCFRWSPPPCAQGWTACTSRLARAKRDLLDGRVKNLLELSERRLAGSCGSVGA